MIDACLNDCIIYRGDYVEIEVLDPILARKIDQILML